MDRWAESDARDLMPSSGGPHHAAGSAPMLQGHESAVIRKRRRPVLDRARNIRQIVVRGSRTDPPTVSGAKEEEDRRTCRGPIRRIEDRARAGIRCSLRAVRSTLGQTATPSARTLAAHAPTIGDIPVWHGRRNWAQAHHLARRIPASGSRRRRPLIAQSAGATDPRAQALPRLCTRGGRGRRRHRYPSPGRSPRAPGRWRR